MTTIQADQTEIDQAGARRLAVEIVRKAVEDAKATHAARALAACDWLRMHGAEWDQALEIGFAKPAFFAQVDQWEAQAWQRYLVHEIDIRIRKYVRKQEAQR